jgi:hypothetical protein
MRVNSFALILIGLCIIFQVESNLLFEMTIDRPRCYVEELFTNSVMVVNYKVEGINDNDQEKITQFLSWISISIISEIDGVYLKREHLKTPSGKISFHSIQTGYYKICVSYHGGWSFPYETMIMLGINSDNMDEPDLSKIIKTHDVDPLHDKARRILSEGQEFIYKQQNETHYEDDTADSQMSNARYYYQMAVVQVLVVLILGVYQVFSFRKFLVNNNVI